MLTHGQRRTRRWAVFLLVLSFGWIPLAGFLSLLGTPQSPWALILVAALFLVPPIAFLALVLLVRALISSTASTAQERWVVRGTFWFAGPLGCAWAVYRLTESDRRQWVRS